MDHNLNMAQKKVEASELEMQELWNKLVDVVKTREDKVSFDNVL